MYGVVTIVLVVVLVLVIEIAEYINLHKGGVEDEDESPAGCGPFDLGFRIGDSGFKKSL